jgi:hypothetical protein
LKPDCFPLPTEVGSVQRHHALENADAITVRMIKPNSIFSHDWHVQPNCQRSLRTLRLSGALLDRGPDVTPGCPRTCCAGRLAFDRLPGVFCANFLNLLELNLPCQARSFSPRPPQLTVGGLFPLAISISYRDSSPLEDSHSAKYQTTTSIIA